MHDNSINKLTKTMTITNIDPMIVLRDSYFANNFSENALEAIGEFLESTFGEIDYAVIDNFLCNATEFDTVEDAMECYNCETKEELEDAYSVIYVDGLSSVVIYG